MKNVDIRDITPANVSDEGIFCVEIERRRDGIEKKMDWFKDRFKEGLRMKKLLVKGKKAGFIEYVPGEYAWRTVEARNYVFIHCIWVRMAGHGYGGLLLQKCMEDARGTNGVAIVTSDEPWLPGKEFFVKNGFRLIQRAPPHFQLLVKQFQDAPLPRFNDGWDARCKRFASGLTVVYSDQCPYIDGAIKHIHSCQEKYGIPVDFEKLENCKQAQFAPGPSGVFTLLYNGKFVTHKPRLPTKLLRRIIKGPDLVTKCAQNSSLG